MALNSSGPISLAGSTAGQSIALELSQSATGTISLNDTAVRNLAGVPSGAITMPTNFWGKSSTVFYLMGSNSSGAYGSPIVVDSSKNVYVGKGDYSGPWIYFKLNETGSVSYQYSLSGGGIPSGWYGTYVTNIIDSSGNLYLLASEGYTVGSPNQSFYIFKYNSSGTLSYQKKFYTSFGTADYDTSVGTSGGTDSSGNLYVITYADSSFFKFDSSGNFVSGCRLPGSYNQNDLVVDSSGNSYVIGYYCTKQNSSGTVQWQRQFSKQLKAGVLNSAGTKLYVAGENSGSDTFVAEVDVSTGAVSWSVIVYSVLPWALALDSSGNIYLTGRRGASVLVWAKLNSSGSLTLAREVSISGYSANGYGITLDTDNNVYLSGVGNQYFGAKLPNDGSKTGTYTVGSTSYTYSAGSQSTASGSITSSSYGPVQNGLQPTTYTTPSLSRNTSTYTFNTTTL